MFGGSEQERLLAAMFSDKYGERGGAELLRFLDQVAQVTLPFDLVEQMRRRDYPGFAGFESGLPSRFYYFVPGSGYGGHHAPPHDPLSPNFVYAIDGVGLNFGDPLRLRRALTALLALPPADQREARLGLGLATKHLSTVEELVWAGVWQPPFRVERPPSGAAKSHDWRIVFPELVLNLECKFIPASWAALVDGDDFRLMKGTLTGKASAQLPNLVPAGSRNVAAVTGITPVDDNLRRLCFSELRDQPSVEVIAYADIAGQITVFSLLPEAGQQVYERLERWPADEFGGFAAVASNRPENERRRTERKKQATTMSTGTTHGLVEFKVESRPPRKFLVPPPPQYPYRYELEKRLPTGEPIFRWVPPFLEKKSG